MCVFTVYWSNKYSTDELSHNNLKEAFKDIKKSMTLETFEWQCIFSHECFPVEVYYFKNWAQKGIAFSISYCYLFSVHNMIIKFSGIQNNNIFNMNVCVNLSDFSVLPETSSKDWINPRLKIIMKFFLLWQSVTHIHSAQNKKHSVWKTAGQ